MKSAHNVLSGVNAIAMMAGLSVLPWGAPVAATAASQKPNVLIITTDQQRVDAMSAAGNGWAKAPHMDSIAANGVYFMRSYCAYPLCSPSRSSLHTGRTPHEIGVNQNTVPIDPAMTISGQVFRAGGYDFQFQPQVSDRTATAAVFLTSPLVPFRVLCGSLPHSLRRAPGTGAISGQKWPNPALRS